MLAATSPPTLARAAVPLLCAGVAAAAYGALIARRVARERPYAVEEGRAFDLRFAVGVAILFSLALLAAGALQDALGRPGVTLVAAVTGLADSQSGAASASSLVAAGKLQRRPPWSRCSPRCPRTR